VIADALEREVIVCCGAGGVGKTTVSAALGLTLAARGEDVVVVTIDPARRLAAALGMAELGDTPQEVSPAAVAASGLGPGGGRMWALQLDSKATFDRLVARHAPSEEARDRILANRIYQHMSGAVAGGQEYMAVERLHELREDGRFARVVLDTPPAGNALDFLDAPERMTRFIEGKALRTLLGPAAGAGKLGWRALHAGTAAAMSLLERLTGAQLLRDIAEFLRGFDGMYAGVAERARSIGELLRSDATGFLVVSAPEPEPAREAVALARRLREDDYRLDGVVVNRLHALPGPGLGARAELAAALAAGRADDDATRLAALAAEALEDARRVAIRDLDLRTAIAGAVAAPLTEVPAMAEEPVEVEGIARVARALTA
jgi:anion-transporting  ArsA/GET3 family ATPase